MQNFSIRIIVLSSRADMVNGFKKTLRTANSIKLAHTCESSEELIGLLNKHDCDVLVLDYVSLAVDYKDNSQLFSYLSYQYPHLKIVALTTGQAAIIQFLMAQPVSAIVSKYDDIGHVITAIHTAYAKCDYMSPKIEAVLQGIH